MSQKQTELFDETEAARSLLDRLLAESKLYKTSKGYWELLQFTSRLRNFAPFNAILLHIQKPGLTYAASDSDWRLFFGRTAKIDARPLLILWPFGPVALVYDVQDTEGPDLPPDVQSFFAHGEITEERFSGFYPKLAKRNIHCAEFDGGDAKAGSIRVHGQTVAEKPQRIYRLQVNRNHSVATKFVTLTHELAHLFLGHLGKDPALNIPERPRPTYAQRELEAESVAYLVCARNGIRSQSEKYLSDFVAKNQTIDNLDLYQVMRAAGQIETILNITSHTRFEQPLPRSETSPHRVS
jgi:hypothetical protein